MFAVQQGSKSDTSKERQPAPLPSVSTPLNIEGAITFCSFLSAQPFIVTATEITFNLLVQKFYPAYNLNVYYAFYVCFLRDNSLYPSIWPKIIRQIYFSLFVYLFFYTFFEKLQYVDCSRS